MTGNDIEKRIDELAERDEGDFMVLRTQHDPNPTRAMYVLIHPGDVVQKKDDLTGCDDDVAEEIFDYSQRCQEIMGREVADLDATEWDIVVLHRISSSYTFCNEVDVDYDYSEAISNLNDSDDATILWGDDLDDASKYLLETMQAKERPLVVIAGAWSHVDGGCVEIVGKQLEAAGVLLKSSYGTCISPDGAEEEWIPAAGRIRGHEMLEVFEPAQAMTA